MHPKTIIITNVDTVESDREYVEIIHMAKDRLHGIGPEIPDADDELLTEIVKGERYVDLQRGIDIIIGSSVKVKNILLAQYGSWKLIENFLKNRIAHEKKQREVIEALLKKSESNVTEKLCELIKIKSAGFFTRLKWLFTGVNT